MVQEPNWFDKEGRPISMREWAGLLAHNEYKRVAETNVNEFWVSTVWIGLDHSYDGSRLIFETMVFTPGDGKIVYGPVRYSTVEAAKEGHKWIVARMTREGNIGNGSIHGTRGPR